MKKLLSVFLAATMLLLLVPFFALGVTAETDANGLVFEKKTRYDGGNYIDYYTLADCPESATSVTIPETFNGLPVNEIKSDAFAACNSIKKINIPKSITIIKQAAIASCASLAELTVDSANPVYYSQGNCILEKETNVIVVGCKASVIPTDAKVTTIGGHAFYRCSGITKIVNKPTTEAGALYIPDNITVIGRDAFCLCPDLESVAFTDSLVTINNYAFQFCDKIESIELGNSVESIGNYCFSYCDLLPEVTIPASVNTIGRYAFYPCKNLTDIYFEADSLPENVGENWASTEDGKNEPEIHFGHESETPDTPVTPEPPVFDDSYDTTGNVALGKNYDAKGYHVESPGIADYTAGLTDGKAANIVSFDNNWFGFCKSESDNGLNAPNGVGTVTIDLEGTYDITSIKVNTAVGENIQESGIYGPAKITAYVSDDAFGNFTCIGDLTIGAGENNVAWAELVKNAKGRYVKIEIQLNGAFAFINEVAVYGTESQPEPENPNPENPDPENPDPENPNPENPDPENPDPENPPVEEPKEGYMLGDVNLNKKIDSMDYVYLKRAYFGTYTLAGIKFKLGDVNENGKIDSMDYVYLKRAYFGTYQLSTDPIFE